MNSRKILFDPDAFSDSSQLQTFPEDSIVKVCITKLQPGKEKRKRERVRLLTVHKGRDLYSQPESGNDRIENSKFQIPNLKSQISNLKSQIPNPPIDYNYVDSLFKNPVAQSQISNLKS